MSFQTSGKSVEATEPVIFGEEFLSTNSAFLIGPAVFCCQRLHKSLRSIEYEDLETTRSSRTARLASLGPTESKVK